jgi:murein L,D-transpeptidase YcbB/YkuD
LELHDKDSLFVPLLRQRLWVTGDYTARASTVDEPVFDAALDEAVKRYQRRNGLHDDGIVGPNTLAMLNIPVEKRIEQLRINLERLRWLPDAPAGRYVLVNVPEYRLRVKEGDRTVLGMKVIVGKQYHSTPIFRDTITYLVFNPTWTVPLRIAQQEILPRLKRDAGYLARNGYRVYRSWRDHATAVDPDSVNWKAMTNGTFTWRLVKEPGPHNPLGAVKFMFPNPFHIYLHDTPKDWLFSRKKRAFSHGCVRVARPIDLAECLLSGSPGWDRSRITWHMGPDQPTTPVALPEPVPVQFIYRTAFVDEEGLVHFRRDLYRHDERQIATLQ